MTPEDTAGYVIKETSVAMHNFFVTARPYPSDIMKPKDSDEQPFLGVSSAYFTNFIVSNWTRRWMKHQVCRYPISVFPKIGAPQNRCFIMENPIKMDDLGVPLFLETPICHGSFELAGIAGVVTAGLEPLPSQPARSQMDGIRWRVAPTSASHQFLGHADRTSKI